MRGIWEESIARAQQGGAWNLEGELGECLRIVWRLLCFEKSEGQ